MCTFKPSQDYYTLSSDRLYFTPIDQSLITVWESFFKDNPSLKFLGFKDSKDSSLEMSQLWISKQMERMNNNEFGQLAIFEKKSLDFIGFAGIIPRKINGLYDYEITYSLLAQYRGKGYATEASILFKEYMFLNTPVNSVISIIHIENEASKKVAIKNGMSIDDEIEFMNMPVFIYRKHRSG